ncbi:MAG: hypothetical protein Q4C49_05315 [Bacillota bacterium]|nr:hypothetical protein [Bacillota bacterium]
MEKKIIYQDKKDTVEDCMSAQTTLKCAEAYLFDQITYYADEMPTEAEWLCYFVALALYELEKGTILPKTEETVTYRIYQYEHFKKYKNAFEDNELLDRDIDKIKSLMHLRFEDLACFEG